MTSIERKNLPTNNLNCERYLAKFGYLASQSSAHSNKLFKGKRIRDDLVLSDCDENLFVEKLVIRTMKLLDDIEMSWNVKQKSLKVEKLRESHKKKARANDFVDQVLLKCKDPLQQLKN